MYSILYLDVCGWSEQALRDLADKEKEVYYFTARDEIDGYRKVRKNIVNIEGEYDVFMIMKKNKNKPSVIFDKRVFKKMFGEDSTFPRIYKDGQLIGGYSDLEKMKNK